MVVVQNRNFTKHSNITHAKNHLERQGLGQKASQTFFDSTSVQRSIVKSINNHFLDFQRLAKSAYFSILLLLLFSYFKGLQQK